MTATKKVLVIDDDPVVGKSFDRVLSPKGYAVIAASGGAEALDRLAREDYDVVFTDIKMPGMDGLEVAKRIKASRPWLPVVIVTGYGTHENESEAREIGVAGFLRKPLSPEMIEASASGAFPAFSPVASPVAAPAVEAAAALPAEKGGILRFLRNVAMFFAAPFVGLAYIVAFPFVGLGLLAWMGYRAISGRREAE